MPAVGGKKFPYSAAGTAAAKRYSKQTGKKITRKKKKKGGY
jgi:hypothetical protein|tara:strand:+ start:524 stop:646 length:123 start_codon:yes stop_codon:yes gene_type:complete